MSFNDQGIYLPTQKIFYKISELDFLKDFTLIGGTALAIHINHRLSEDLDFCIWDRENPLDITKISGEIYSNFDVKKEEQLSANHIDFYLGENHTKVSFFRDNINQPIISKSKLCNNIHIASEKGIAAMKLNVIRLRSKYRDLYDVYYLSKKFRVSDMIDWAARFKPTVQKKAFRINLLNPDKIEDESISYLKPKTIISANEIRLELGKKIKNEMNQGITRSTK